MTMSLTPSKMTRKLDFAGHEVALSSSDSPEPTQQARLRSEGVAAFLRKEFLKWVSCR